MLRILLVEDNIGDIMLVQQALEEHRIPHELRIFADGAQALDYVVRMGQPDQPPCPDLILLDLNLPKVTGPEILKAFRQHPECATVPIIVVTSSDAPKDRLRIAEFGIARYFKKPFEFDAFLQLGAVVREVVGEAAA